MFCWEIQLFENLESEGAKKIEIAFKVVQIKFLAMHIKLLIKNEVLIYLQYKISSWNMIFAYYPNDFWHKI